MLVYDRKTVLSLKLRSGVQLRKKSRAEFFTYTQVTRTVEPVVMRAFREVEDARLRSDQGNSPHGKPWHTSFHASQFPGDDPLACPRQSLYRMMNFPPVDPFSRRSRFLMEVGKAMEVTLVQAMYEAGILLSAPPDAEHQTGFEYPEAWLTGSVDCIIQPFNWNKPLPIEIKSKDRATVEAMQAGRGPDDAHVSQLKVQLALVRIFQQEMWPGLDPVTHGFIYYMSRGDKKGEQSLLTAEFRVDLDLDFFKIGVARLKEWAELFRRGVLPSDNPSKRHPMGWRWSYQPCQFCSYKKTCKLDFEHGTDDLTQSIGVDRAEMIRPGYDSEIARAAVLGRWNGKGT